MALVLTITSFHKFTPEIETTFVLSTDEEHFRATFGRSETNDWVLPDPDRVVSGTHGEIVKFGSSFLVKDLSTNGVYLNNGVSPLGKGNEQSLNAGDQISFGDYQIDVTFEKGDVESSDKTELMAPPPPEEENYQPSFDDSNSQASFGFDAHQLYEQDTELDSNPPHANDLDAGLTDDFIDLNTFSSQIDKPTENSASPFNQMNDVRSDLHSNSHFGRGGCELAFLKGLGIKPEAINVDDPELWFEQLGRSYSMMLIGLMETLHNRAAFKQSNRLNHTAFKRSENNPLKFSASVEDAIHNLYLRKTSSFMGAEEAIKEAFNDIDKHEKALMKGVGGAVSGVMTLLDPETIERSLPESNKVLNSTVPNRKARLSWKKFEQMHAHFDEEMTSSESPFYLDDFAKHYEQALKSD